MMEDFWESKFIEAQTNWGFEASDSASIIQKWFAANNKKNILIPGIGYGRNAKIFLDCGIDVTGIEISKTAISLAKSNGIDIHIHHGSVTQMPFDNKAYDGIFCYALLHLLNKTERKIFIQNCYNQLKPGGLMAFTVVSTKASMFESGKPISKNRFELSKGLKVYFYNPESATNEFKYFGLVDCMEIDEPIKHLKNEPPLKCLLIKCVKPQ